MEFAILPPLLVVLLTCIVEFGWLYAQNIDVRHGARDGARLAATGELAAADIITQTCARMELDGLQSVEIGLQRQGPGIGDRAQVAVSATPRSITGMLDPLLPSRLESSVVVRLEQTAAWSTTEFETC